MTPQAVAQALRRRGLHAEVEEGRAHGHRRADGAGAPDTVPIGVRLELNPEQLSEVLRLARDQLGFSLLTSLTATDEGDHFALLYHLVRPMDPELPGYLVVVLRALKDAHPDGPLVPSAVPVYPGANLQEREVFDLMGVRFRGHPRLTRVLTWPGFCGHPLRKDYVPVDEEIPWRLAGLRGPDGSLIGEDDDYSPADDRALWEEIAVDAPLSVAPAPSGDAVSPPAAESSAGGDTEDAVE